MAIQGRLLEVLDECACGKEMLEDERKEREEDRVRIIELSRELADRHLEVQRLERALEEAEKSRAKVQHQDEEAGEKVGGKGAPHPRVTPSHHSQQQRLFLPLCCTSTVPTPTPQMVPVSLPGWGVASKPLCPSSPSTTDQESDARA